MGNFLLLVSMLVMQIQNASVTAAETGTTDCRSPSSSSLTKDFRKVSSFQSTRQACRMLGKRKSATAARIPFMSRCNFGGIDTSSSPTTLALQHAPYGIHQQQQQQQRRLVSRRGNTCWALCAKTDDEDNLEEDDDDDDDDDDLIDFEEADWRDFRAKLVTLDDKTTTTTPATTEGDAPKTNKQEESSEQSSFSNSQQAPPKNSDKSSSSSSSATSSWAYDCGNVIEEGSIILSNLEQDFGYGLNQQYFHKCVILVLSHDPHRFTKGIILNRPCDLILNDDDFMYEDGSPLESPLNPHAQNNQWNVWFGGDVQGLSDTIPPESQMNSDTNDDDEEEENVAPDTISPEIICLHSLSTSAAKQISIKIMKGIYWTTFEGARSLVQSGDATSHDFWVFCGYSGWAANQLQDELQRGAWSMVATDSKTLLQELQTQSLSVREPREAGIHTWELLMSMIGRKEESLISSGDFDDLMLREWARDNLQFQHDDEADDQDNNSRAISVLDTLYETSSCFSMGKFQAGTLLRGSSADRSPFLLTDQRFHKSIILILQDEDEFTMGLLLNHPSARSIEFVVHKKSNHNNSDDDDDDDDDDDIEEIIEIPQRYGGEFGVQGEEEKPSFWFHCSATLRDSQIGEPLSKEDYQGIWKVEESEVLDAVRSGIAGKNDFMAVNGLAIWPTEQGGGLLQEIATGNFEIVPRSKTKVVWDELISQGVLSSSTMEKNLMLARSAWQKAGASKGEDTETKSSRTKDDTTSYVFKSNVKVSDLCDDALRCWVAAYLLGEPILRLSNSAFG